MGGTHQSPPTSSLLPCAGRSKRVALGGSSSLRSGAAARHPPLVPFHPHPQGCGTRGAGIRRGDPGGGCCRRNPPPGTGLWWRRVATGCVGARWLCTETHRLGLVGYLGGRAAVKPRSAQRERGKRSEEGELCWCRGGKEEERCFQEGPGERSCSGCRRRRAPGSSAPS